MNRKWIGVLISVVLAGIGTFVLVQYVKGADDRALEGQETVDVLVVSDTIPAGSAAEDISAQVVAQRIPVTAQAIGSVDTLAPLAGTVTAVELVPGEQVISTRFITLETFQALEQFVVPDGLLEVTLSLSPERAVGGELQAGDLVAFVASFTPFDLTGVEPTDEGLTQEQEDELAATAKTPSSTHIIIHNVLVSNVQLEKLPAPKTQDAAAESGIELAPTGNLLVTLAVNAPNVEKIVYTAEWGLIWLAQENGELTDRDFEETQIQTRNLIYR